MVELIGGFVNVVPVAVFLEVIHKNDVNTTVVALGNVCRPCFCFLPFLGGELVAEIEDVVHLGAFLVQVLRLGGFVGAVLGRFRRFGGFADAVRRAVCKDVVRRGLCHGPHRLRECRGAHRQVLAVPRTLRHVGLHCVGDNVGQLLRIASRLAQGDIDAPVLLGHRIRAVRLRSQQQRQRDAFLFLAQSVIRIPIDIRGDIPDRAVLHALVGKHVHPQVNAQRFRQLRERLFPQIGQLVGADLLRLIVERTVLRARQGRGAQGQRQQKRQQECCQFSFHARTSLTHQHHKERTQHGQRRSNGGKQRPEAASVHGQVAHEFSGLPVHGKEKVLVLPLGVQHPHGQHRIVDLACLDACVFPPWKTGLITLHAVSQRRLQRAHAARVGPLTAFIYRYIMFVGKKTGEIGRGKGLKIAVVIRLDGVHVVVRHFAGSIHRHLFKGHRAGAVNVIMLRLRDPEKVLGRNALPR